MAAQVLETSKRAQLRLGIFRMRRRYCLPRDWTKVTANALNYEISVAFGRRCWMPDVDSYMFSVFTMLTAAAIGQYMHVSTEY